MTVVDLHNHFIPPALVSEARRGPAFDGVRTDRVNGQEWLVHRQGYGYPLWPGFYEIEARLAAMDSLGIDHAVTSVSPTVFFYWAERSEAIDFCKQTNDSLAQFAAAGEGRLHAVATLPMQDPDAAVVELERAVEELGLVGAEIGPVIEAVQLDDPDVRPVLRKAEELEVPLILHPYYVGQKRGLESYYLTNLVGNPLDTCVAASRLILGSVLDELPMLDLVLMHGGGFLPYQIGRLDHGHRVRPEAKGCAAPPSTYLRRFTFDTLTHAPAALQFLVSLVGPDRVAYGTDYPYDMGGGSFAEQATGAGLDEESAAAIAGENARRLFGLGAASGP